jgi:hypothetical protein
MARFFFLQLQKDQKVEDNNKKNDEEMYHEFSEMSFFHQTIYKLEIKFFI